MRAQKPRQRRPLVDLRGDCPSDRSFSSAYREPARWLIIYAVQEKTRLLVNCDRSWTSCRLEFLVPGKYSFSAPGSEPRPIHSVL